LAAFPWPCGRPYVIEDPSLLIRSGLIKGFVDHYSLLLSDFEHGPCSVICVTILELDRYKCLMEIF